MTNKPVTEALKKVVADTYALQLMTQNYHWNVEGPRFPELHALFETQYTELFAAVDTLAERIRALGEKAPGSFSEFKKLSTISDGDSSLDENGMVRDLYIANQSLLQLLKKSLATADKAGDDSTVDLLTQRITAHDKASWMLKSTLPKEARLKLAS